MIAIKFGEMSDPKQLSGLIFIDAVTSYGKDFSGRVTEHPLETGVSVSDHFISNNPKFTISGVLSSVDLSPIPFSVQVEGEIPINANPPPPALAVNNIGSGLLKFLPDSITQFLPNSLPSIHGSSERQDHKEDVENLLETLVNGVHYNEDKGRWENRMTVSTIYETEDGKLGRSYEDCILVQYSVKEEVESGDALFVDLTFEQVRFATSESAQAPTPQAGSPEARGSAKTKNKGTVTTKKPDATTLPKTPEANESGGYSGPYSTDPVGTN